MHNEDEISVDNIHPRQSQPKKSNDDKQASYLTSTPHGNAFSLLFAAQKKKKENQSSFMIRNGRSLKTNLKNVEAATALTSNLGDRQGAPCSINTHRQAVPCPLLFS